MCKVSTDVNYTECNLSQAESDRAYLAGAMLVSGTASTSLPSVSSAVDGHGDCSCKTICMQLCQSHASQAHGKANARSAQYIEARQKPLHTGKHNTNRHEL